jgi:hypothetical protein
MMKDEINQNKDALLKKGSKSKEKEAKPASEVLQSGAAEVSGKEEQESFSFPTSLNEDLDELLAKNPRRFFGGCGG